jgi:hypothetical protein
LAADLKAGAALVLAGMVAEGTAHIERVSHVDRGYEKLDHKLPLLGASIQRLPCLPFDSTLTLSENFDSLLALSHLGKM